MQVLDLYDSGKPHGAINAIKVSNSGGHNIPDDVIRRRFAAGLNQFEKTYKPIVNAWFLYNNQHRPPILLSEGVNP